MFSINVQHGIGLSAPHIPFPQSTITTINAIPTAPRIHPLQQTLQQSLQRQRCQVSLSQIHWSPLLSEQPHSHIEPPKVREGGFAWVITVFSLVVPWVTSTLGPRPMTSPGQ